MSPETVGLIEKLVLGVLAISTAILGYLSQKRSNKVKVLEEKIEYLERRINKKSSKVNPESGRMIIKEAEYSIQIHEINALGSLHHSFEELKTFLKKNGSILQVVLLDPSSIEFNNRVSLEGDNARRILTEWNASLTILKDLHNQTGGTIDLRLFTTVPDRSLLIVDSTKELTEKSKMMINYYPKERGKRGYEGEQFLAEYIVIRDRDSFKKNLQFLEECLKNAERVELENQIELVSEMISS